MTKVILVSHEEVEAIKRHNEEVWRCLDVQPSPFAESEAALQRLHDVMTDPNLQMTNHSWELAQKRKRQHELHGNVN